MTSVHPMLHPLTNTPVVPIGFRKDGRAIWPVMGGDGTTPPPQPPAPAPAPAPPVPAPLPQPQYQQPPAPAPAPPVPAPPPAPGTPAPQPPAPAPASQPQTPSTEGDNGFPANTPWRDMTQPQQIAYWQHQSRKHEQRNAAMADYEQLKATAAEHARMVEATQTEHQRAVAEARRQGASEALATANNQLVEQWVRSAAVGRLAPESVDALLAGLDRQRFVTNGAVDTDKVWSFVSSLAPAPAASAPTPVAPGTPPAPSQPPQQQPLTQGPDFGQGQPPVTPLSGLDQGREIARQRYAQQNTTKPTILQ